MDHENLLVNYLDNIVASQKSGIPAGITSICSANKQVLTACMRFMMDLDIPLLIESTCNQVNQYGGYTNMRPKEFIAFTHQIAEQLGFPIRRLIIGGDHIGPNVWKKEPADMAIEKSRVLVRDYVLAGYQKFHIDTSMGCADDPTGQPLEPEVIAERTADLVEVAESTFEGSNSGRNYLRYVIGTEVPPPGGIQGTEETFKPTITINLQETINLTRTSFYLRGLHSAWERVIAVVVQPGVEFGDQIIIDYNPEASTDLVHFIENVKGMVYEVHSTDYQTPIALRQLVSDHFAILKVGPALTFAFREAVYALAQIEKELYPIGSSQSPSNIITIIEDVMRENPAFWRDHYLGNEAEVTFSLHYSFSDRVRYYWNFDGIYESFKRLIYNLDNKQIPLSLLSQYLPKQFQRVRMGIIENNPDSIIEDKIIEVLEGYHLACRGDPVSLNHQ